MGDIQDARAVAPLIEALKDKDLYVHMNAATALREIGTPAVEPLITALKDEDPAVRIEAVDILGNLNDPRSFESLIDALKDANQDVRSGALSALRYANDIREVEAFIGVLKNEAIDPYIRGEVAISLGNNKDPRAIDSLITALKDEKYGGIQESAAKALREIGTPAVEPLIAALKDEDPNVRSLAAWALKGSKDARLDEPLMVFLISEDLVIIHRAYPFYIEAGRVGSEPVLIQALWRTWFDPDMALDFVYSGNDLLAEGGREFLKSYFWEISSEQLTPDHPIWGSDPK